MIATGVASPKAHGQDITRTQIAKLMQWDAMKAPSTMSQTKRVIIASSETMGTKTDATLSANF